MNTKKTICFSTMCKNEEHCILDALTSVYKYIDYWVVCDTGSADNTVQIVRDFFKDKNIPGEIYTDEWVNYGYNKNLLFERSYNKTDFIIHFEPDDILIGDLTHIDSALNVNKNIAYYMNMKRQNYIYKDYCIINNRFKWKIGGIAHNPFTCTNNYDNLPIGDLTNHEIHILSRDIGSGKNQLDKYYNAISSKEQFFDTLLIDEDNLNYRSIFYTAQCFYDCNDYKEACQWYCIYTKLKNTGNEQLYECYKQIVYCMIHLDYPVHQIIQYARKGIEMLPDRAEIYVIMGKYFMSHEKFELAFFNIQKAYELDITVVKNKYTLPIDVLCYGTHLLPLLTKLAFKTGRIDVGQEYLNLITDKKMHKELTDAFSTIINYLS
jgi:glycosyltransferase involved in cell wall biosynthesis